MNTAATVAVTLLAAAVTSAVVTVSIAPEASPNGRAEEGASPDGLEKLARAVSGMEARQEAIAASIAKLELDVASVSGAGGRVDVGQIEAAVARVLAREAGAPVPATEVDGADVAGLPAEDLMARLLALEGGDEWDSDAQNLWQEIRDAGRTDEILALFEARAEKAPNDPDVQLELGQAYLQKIQEVGNGPLAGVFATKADASFDRALDLDPGHWEARFHKAVSLSFWPPIFGKQNEAIQQFEILVGQQAEHAPAGNHAQTHLLLGNMYQQIGDHDKAVAAWQAGAVLFPDNEALLQQLALVEGGD